MKSKVLIGAAAILSVGAIAWAAKDPVVMIINGEEVPRSEFEYLYHKNSQQQVEAQPLEDYIGMFELYKMKVADAKAEGIDTTSEFKNEMAQYRLDLAKPYMADSVYLNQLVDEAYLHSLTENEYYHIMLPKGRSQKEAIEFRHRADSVRDALKGGADFAALARQYSIDRNSNEKGGRIGYVASGRFPYDFEVAAYSLAPGEISEVVESSAGYHILKGGKKRDSRGSVNVSHILKLARPGCTPEQEAAAKAAIDSLYEVVIADPTQFAAVAAKNSDDVGSARMGGQVGWFVAGQMVPEFQETSFDLEKGEISKPVRTEIGWHIIKKNDARGVRSKEEIKPQLLSQFADARDDRYKKIRARKDAMLEKKYKARLNEDLTNKMKGHVVVYGMDSVFYAKYAENPEAIWVINGMETPVSWFVANMRLGQILDPYVSAKALSDKIESMYDKALEETEEDWLYANNEDYRNLLNEYRDGSLLYEVSLRKVWDKAAQDTEGLDKYFKAHRDSYKFKEPRVKGILVQARDDSIATLVKNRYKELGADTAFTTLRNEFRTDALVDRLLAQKGINRIVDHLMFDGPVPEPNAKYPVYFILDGRILNEPEDVNDVKGAVTADYQQMLEQNWTTELRKKYPVKRNNSELKKIK